MRSCVTRLRTLSSIISVMDGTLPKKPCKTCKNRFHAGCLYKVRSLAQTSLYFIVNLIQQTYSGSTAVIRQAVLCVARISSDLYQLGIGATLLTLQLDRYLLRTFYPQPVNVLIVCSDSNLVASSHSTRSVNSTLLSLTLRIFFATGLVGKYKNCSSSLGS